MSWKCAVFTQHASTVPPLKNGHCGFKKLNCPLACAERCDWWARWSPWRRGWKQEPLLAVCGSSWSVWLPFRKVAHCSAHNDLRAVLQTQGWKNVLVWTCVHSGRNNSTYSQKTLFNLRKMWRVVFFENKKRQNKSRLWEETPKDCLNGPLYNVTWGTRVVCQCDYNKDGLKELFQWLSSY